MFEARAIQNSFHKMLVSYLNGIPIRKHPLTFFSKLSKDIYYYNNADTLINCFNKYSSTNVPVLSESYKLRIPHYEGTNPVVHKIMNILNAELCDYLHSAYVHGSLGTYEEVEYSDFDGLVILNKCCFADKKSLVNVFKILDKCQKLMLQQDPLQHHGWFILTYLDLRYYCDTYFPKTLFSYSKSLLHNKDEHLTILSRDSKDESISHYYEFSNSIIERINSNVYPSNMYQTKLFISKILLLPSLFLSAMGEPVWKKYSFDLLNKYIDNELLVIFSTASCIRDSWDYIPSSFNNLFIKYPNNTTKYLFNEFSKDLDHNIIKQLDSKYFVLLRELISQLGNYLTEKYNHEAH